MNKSSGDSRCSFLGVPSVPGPGPGAYKIKSKMCEGPRITLKGRLRSKSIPLLPGPGQYDIPTEKVPGFVMGISKRDLPRPESVKSAFPGPGTYAIPHEYFGCKWTFSKPTRSASSEAFEKSDPGPGSYNFKSTLSKRTHKFTSKRPDTQQKSRASMPGPGAYEPTHPRPNSSIHIGISKRPEIKYNSVPGPGTYTVQSRPSSAAASFGIGKRSDMVRTIECHNSYTLPTTIGEGPKIKFRPKICRKVVSLGPGPGAYSPEDSAKIPTFLFGISKRELRNAHTVGPGPVYAVEAPYDGPAWGFGCAPRSKETLQKTEPGPGSYEKKSTLKQHKITFKKRPVDLSQKYSKTIPGPGTYDEEMKPYIPSWTMGKAGRGLEWSDKEKAAIKNKLGQSEILSSSNPNLLTKAGSNQNLYRKKG